MLVMVNESDLTTRLPDDQAKKEIEILVENFKRKVNETPEAPLSAVLKDMRNNTNIIILLDNEAEIKDKLLSIPVEALPTEPIEPLEAKEDKTVYVGLKDDKRA